MKKILATLCSFAAVALPLVATADTLLPTGGGLEMAITAGYYVSALGFLIAAIMMAVAVKQFGASALGSIFMYFFIGTGIFFVITVFQKLGAEFFGIQGESMDIWWHLMFYLGMISYFIGLKALVGLGDADSTQSTKLSDFAHIWAGIVAFVLAAIFVIPAMSEPVIIAYNASSASQFGLHHFLAFAIAALVGWYLLSAQKNIGQIGRAIAYPMLIAIWALALQHLWELQFESWKTVIVSSEVGEGGEKIFLTIAAIGVTFAAVRLRSNARG